MMKIGAGSSEASMNKPEEIQQTKEELTTMKKLLGLAFAVALLAVNVSAQIPAGRCSIPLEQSPTVRGMKWGQPVNDVQKLNPCPWGTATLFFSQHYSIRTKGRCFGVFDT